ncbi:hypothetical protein [Tautonia plasticadhaerens]|uniref:Uncharacterized protein n=1 Tax=Tautonia plasticadhaerens TaxID=2527974 RepID=A0A518GWM5_9BACT|nr:hypothetical protein [Tautonia plasticadhaerens]QDV32996.1 hypothetical protein ElP_08380 [Tautonia plasticadhaerens]
MIASRPGLFALALSAAVSAVAPASRAQVTTGADRYMGSTQASLGRASAMGSNFVTPGAGSGSAMIGAANQSFDRTNAAMRSMLTNRAATVRGLGQAAVYRTPDNLYGVYWQMHYANQARLVAVGSSGPFGMTPAAARAMMEANARRQLQMEVRGEQLRRRMDLYNPELPPDPGIFTPDTILNDVPGADLIRRDRERQADELRARLGGTERPRARGDRPRD